MTRFNQQVLVDTTPMPESIPKVDELGATSAPLASASYFIGDRCRAYNDDYMKCKTEANGRGEIECLKEGRKVTRCAASVYVHPGPRHSARRACRAWLENLLMSASASAESRISTPTA